MDNKELIKEIYSCFCSCDALSTDSRTIAGMVKEGKKVMFIALKGERYDANQFIDKVLDSGAAYVVTTSNKYSDDSRRDDRSIVCNAVTASNNYRGDSRVIEVKDTLLVLQQLATYHREQMNAKIVVVTGSNGKTTTKELLTAVLSQKYSVISTVGNLNNHIGVPLTLLSITKNNQIAVVEHGANHIGEIAELCSISKPDFGIITNIGRAHLDGFGGAEGIVRAKGELYDYLAKNGGVAFYNSDIQNIKNKIDSYQTLKIISYNSEKYDVESIASSSQMKFKKSGVEVSTNLIGDYNIFNVLAAIEIGAYFEVEIDSILSAISSYVPRNMRSQLTTTDRNSVVVDAYNANPSSMEVAIDNFSKNSTFSQKQLYILGQMNELGSYSEVEHQTVVEKLSKIGAEAILIGKEFEKSANMYGYSWYESVESAIESADFEKIENYNILLKGSRSVGVEKILEKL
ncbi:MAG: UDP-N-acetylmuramoyl-tripeptide--D-alanyl-D-alanine ligase [Rikenellaceae bacterium]